MNQITTDVQIDPQYYEDGTVVISLDRFKGNPNRTVDVKLYEYDEDVSNVSSASSNVIRVKSLPQVEEKQFVKVDGLTGIVKYNAKEAANIKISVFDITGRNVYNETMSNGDNNKINLSTKLMRGVYFYRIEIGKTLYKGKITIVK